MYFTTNTRDNVKNKITKQIWHIQLFLLYYHPRSSSSLEVQLVGYFCSSQWNMSMYNAWYATRNVIALNRHPVWLTASPGCLGSDRRGGPSSSTRWRTCDLGGVSPPLVSLAHPRCSSWAGNALARPSGHSAGARQGLTWHCVRIISSASSKMHQTSSTWCRGRRLGHEGSTRINDGKGRNKQKWTLCKTTCPL